MSINANDQVAARAMNKIFGTSWQNRSISIFAIVSSVITLILLLNIWVSYTNFKQLIQRDLRLTRLSGDILHLDEVLTMSARMAAVTGEEYWIKRYETSEPNLDAALKLAKQIAPPSFRNDLQGSDTANDWLVRAEYDCLVSVENGNLEMAKTYVFNEDYNYAKEMYLNGLQRNRQMLEANAEQNIVKTRQWVNFSSFLAMIGIVTSTLALVLGMKRSRKEHQLQMELASLNRRQTAESLATSLAHEFNQPMAAIQHYADAGILIAREKNIGFELSEVLDGIKKQVTRASQVLDRTRKFLSRHESGEAKVDISEVLHNTHLLLKHFAKQSGVDLLFRNHHVRSIVQGDAVQIQQVLVNLIINGIQACEETENSDGHPAVTVNTRQTDNHVSIIVSDTGPGVSAKDREKIFDSFYTTKENGLGLGLSISRELTENQGGRLSLKNGQHGAEFELLLQNCQP